MVFPLLQDGTGDAENYGLAFGFLARPSALLVRSGWCKKPGRVGNAFLPTFYRLFRWAKKPAHPTWLNKYRDKGLVLVTVHGIENISDNVIPGVFAEYIAKQMRFDVESNIVQTTKGADGGGCDRKPNFQAM